MVARVPGSHVMANFRTGAALDFGHLLRKPEDDVRADGGLHLRKGFVSPLVDRCDTARGLNPIGDGAVE